jgi:hypothetical protein
LNYWDFPRFKEAFARGQKDARPEVIEGCYYRRRGVTKPSMTLVSFDDPNKAWGQLQSLKADGVKVKALDYFDSRPTNLPTLNSPKDWLVEDFPTLFAVAKARHGKRLRQLSRQGEPELVIPSFAQALRIFQIWEDWAKERHFMVIKGQYLKWLSMYFEAPENCRLLGVRVGGSIEGLFGCELSNDFVQVTLVRHTPKIEGKVIWVRGLLEIGAGKTALCGFAPDAMKSELGFTPRPSWTFDLSKL